MIKLKYSKCKDAVIQCMKAGLVPMVKSSPGIGKSSLVRDIANQAKLKVIDIRLAQIESIDLNGFPDLSGKYATYKPFDTFPTEDTPIPDGYVGWIIFFDELNSADRDLLGSAYKIILDRMVGQEKLHPNAFCVAAGNLSTDNAVVTELPTAMQSRLVHLNLNADLEEWINHAIEADYDHRIISFLEFRPDFLMKFDPNHNDETFCSPRTWEFASRLCKDIKDLSERLPVIAGAVTEGVAREFIAFSKLTDHVNIKDVLASPDTADVPKDTGTLFAITGMLAGHATKDNIDTLMIYIERLPNEHQLSAVRKIKKIDTSVIASKSVREWLRRNKSWAA